MRMRPLIAAAILFPLLLPVETLGARARPLLLPALSDCELATASAGQAIAIPFEDKAPAGLVTESGAIPAPDIPGIRTIARDGGASSLNQAVTSIAIMATLARPAVQR